MRTLLPLLALALGPPSFAASAQTAPPRALRILVPFSAGGASDTYTRIAALKISEQTGKTFVVENRTGAGGRIAWEAAAKSAPDGTTAALIDATYPMLPGLYDKLPWDVASDLVPSAMIAQTPFVIVVNTGSRLESLAALIAEARTRPGKLNFGSAGVGSVIHVVSELFNATARVNLTHIPYKAMSDASVALQAGQNGPLLPPPPTAPRPHKGGQAGGPPGGTAQASA